MTQNFNYKEALKELESIVQTIEKGETDVDQLMEMVNRASVLVKQCKTKLKQTEGSLNESLQDLDQ